MNPLLQGKNEQRKCTFTKENGQKLVSDKVNNRRKVRGLTHKQQLFVKEYLVDLNATQAAIRAGYSKKTANNQVHQLLVNIGIQQALKEELEKKFAKIDRLSDKVLDELIKIATADIKDFMRFDENGMVLHNSDDVDGTMINEVSSATIENETQSGTNRRTNLKIKLHDKMKALEMLGRYAGLFNKENEEDTVEQRINKIETVVIQIVKTPEQIEAEKRGGRTEGE